MMIMGAIHESVDGMRPRCQENIDSGGWLTPVTKIIRRVEAGWRLLSQEIGGYLIVCLVKYK